VLYFGSFKVADKCIVCNKTLGMFDDVTYVTVDTKDKEIHHPCRNAFFLNPENYGGRSSDRVIASGTSTGTASVSGINSKPTSISILYTLGWFLFVISGLSGMFLISQDGTAILGVSLIFAGVFQLSIFLGFSTIIDQLYKINVNTSQSDMDD
tara:strand:+ start:89 stop:547 length:459 start_codon:yes stop_codon:yes gene_type:complete